MSCTHHNPYFVAQASSLSDETCFSWLRVICRAVDGRRLAAFAKRLCGAALAGDSGEAMGCLALVNRLLRRNSKLRSMLEHERSGAAGAAVVRCFRLWSFAAASCSFLLCLKPMRLAFCAHL